MLHLVFKLPKRYTRLWYNIYVVVGTLILLSYSYLWTRLIQFLYLFIILCFVFCGNVPLQTAIWREKSANNRWNHKVTVCVMCVVMETFFRILSHIKLYYIIVVSIYYIDYNIMYYNRLYLFLKSHYNIYV